jgi:TrmH family RNA methyltransferase
MITSKQNEKIKQIRTLLSRKARQETGKFLVEGIHLVGQAVEAGARIDGLIYDPASLSSEFAWQLIRQVEERNIPCTPVSSQVFDSIASKENPQGLLAVVYQPWQDLSILNPGVFRWGIALLAPQDPGNIGTILRTLDAVGADGLLLLDDPPAHLYSAEVTHPNAVRASMGAIFWLKVVKTTFREFTDWAKKNHYTLYGTSSHSRQDYRSIDAYDDPAILLMGNEQKGLNPAQASICDYLLSLPMHGRASSLNLAVAAGVFLYDMLLKRPASPR